MMPHFHLILPTVRWIAKEKVSEVWQRVIGAKRPISVDLDSLSNETKHAIYVAKYCAKIPDNGKLGYVPYVNIRGRHWGFHRPEQIPYHTKIRFENIPIDLVDKIQHIASQETRWFDQFQDAGVSIFGEFGYKIADKIRQLTIDADLRPLVEYP